MTTSVEMVRKYLRHERRQRGWSQLDLAKAAGIKSRTTIQKLEDGLKLSEGVEGAVEKAVGWKIGDLDVIRNGGEPTTQESSHYPAEIYTKTPRDRTEEKILALKGESDGYKWGIIFELRERTYDAERPPGSAMG